MSSPNHDLVQRLAFGHYLEIGVNEGDSLRAALAGGRVTFAVGVDTWGVEAGGTGRGSPDHVISTLSAEIMASVLLITGDSKVILPGLRHPFDTIFIDGDHSIAGCSADLENSIRLLRSGGLLLVDDIENPNHQSLRDTVLRFADKHRLFTAFHQVHCGVAELRLQP